MQTEYRVESGVFCWLPMQHTPKVICVAPSIVRLNLESSSLILNKRSAAVRHYFSQFFSASRRASATVSGDEKGDHDVRIANTGCRRSRSDSGRDPISVV